MKKIFGLLVATVGFVSISFGQSDGCTGVPALSVGASCSATAYTLPGTYTNGAMILASCFSAGNDRDDGWYSVTAPSTGTMTIELGGDQGHTLAVFTTCGGGTELGCDQQAAGATSTVSFSATNGVTYYVQVHRNQGNNTADMSGTICAYMGAPSSGPHIIGTGDLNSCSGDLFDTGGSGGDYTSSELITETYCSSTPGQCIEITFNSFSTESCCDELSIYDGTSASDPLIGTFAGSTSPGTVTSSAGCLTFVWDSDGSIVYPGWDATIACVACPTCTDGIQNGTETGVDCGGANCTPCPCGGGPVPNDEACCATTLTVNSDASCGSVTASTIANATASPVSQSACGGTENDDVWFEFTATNSIHYIDLLNIGGSTSDLYHSVWEGSCGAPTLVAGSCSDPESSTVTGLTPGNTYYVRVYSWSSSAGATSTFDICIGSPPPPPTNDECADAISLTVNTDAVCNNVTYAYTIGATQSQSACAGTADDDVWFSFVALDPNQSITISNTTGSSDMVHELFEGTCGSLTSLGCSDPESSNYTTLTTGQTYYVRVYTYSSTGSNTGFDICITSPCGVSGTPPDCGLNYTHSTIAYNPANYNTGSALSFTDDRFADAYTSIGFDFCFDGITYSECLVSSNGYIIFPGCYSTAPTATTVTPGGSSDWDIDLNAPNTTNAPTNAILGPWQDIDPSVSGVIRTSTEGTAPNRVFIVKFDDVAMFSCNSLLYAGQIMLYETTNNIEIHMGEKTTCSTWNEEGAILGLTGYDGTSAVIPSGYNYSTPWTVPTNSPEGHLFTNNCTTCNVILPVELINFEGEKNGETNVLTWSTASELNNDYFVLEHSLNGVEFEALITIDGMGTTQEMTNYRFVHPAPEKIEYYRLRQVDLDGSVSYSKSISVLHEEILVTMYPNPSEGMLFMDCKGVEGLLTIRYVDVVGQSFEEHVKVIGSSQQIALDRFETLSAGMYTITVTDVNGNEVHQEKIVKR